MSKGTRWTQTWLGGARAAGADLGYPGERLGLPEKGSGAVAGYGRRIVALLLDLLVAALIGALLANVLDWSPGTRSLANTGIFALQAWLLTATLGMTIGKRLTGIRVVRLDGKPVGPGWSLARTFLLILIIPAMIWDRDNRGMHDRAANTIVINT
ncbi:RDD family protein [Actinomadura rudentiformis]|uniref:RDD family protein n=1 Tax=Actinomadura rudentiformis TaxID=359158 RepID=A0A6H9YWR2_9ACTN|nr:RDD family protein [Actinomadura rudentiformis]KAB2345461.1 RDD family protein [Actinomadura rudentiformis]